MATGEPIGVLRLGEPAKVLQTHAARKMHQHRKRIQIQSTVDPAAVVCDDAGNSIQQQCTGDRPAIQPDR